MYGYRDDQYCGPMFAAGRDGGGRREFGEDTDLSRDAWRERRGFPFDGLFASFFGKAPRARRGDVRAGILALLAEGSYNGYQIMQELEKRSDGFWRPSPGSVYPTLQQLEEEGLIAGESASGGNGRVFHLTEQGQAFVHEHESDLTAPWDAMRFAAGNREAHQQLHDLRNQILQIARAAREVARAGNAAQVAKAVQLMAETRRSLYRILADGGSEDA